MQVTWMDTKMKVSLRFLLLSKVLKIPIGSRCCKAILVEGRIIEFAEKPKGEQVDTTILGLDDERAKEMPLYIASMGIYVVSKDGMINLLRDEFPAANDFGSEVIPGATFIKNHWGNHLLQPCEDFMRYLKVLVILS